MIPNKILSGLTPEEIQDCDLRAMGNLILRHTITLSHAVNEELLEPISQWLDDPHFMERHAITIEPDSMTWADRKAEQRMIKKMNQVEISRKEKYEYINKIHEMLNHHTDKGYKKKIEKLIKDRAWVENSGKGDLHKLYLSVFQTVKWHNKKLEKEFRKTILKDVIPSINDAQNCKCTDAHNRLCTEPAMHKAANAQSILSILTPFSPIEQHRAETNMEFKQTLEMHLSNLLPWRLLLADQLHDIYETSFNALTPIIKSDPKADKISKFQHLLQMDKDGEITLQQETPEDDIQIIPTSRNLIQDQEIIIKDRSGKTCEFDWTDLSDAQQNKVITDTIERKIICKTV